MDFLMPLSLKEHKSAYLKLNIYASFCHNCNKSLWTNPKIDASICLKRNILQQEQKFQVRAEYLQAYTQPGSFRHYLKIKPSDTLRSELQHLWAIPSKQVPIKLFPYTTWSYKIKINWSMHAFDVLTLCIKSFLPHKSSSPAWSSCLLVTQQLLRTQFSLLGMKKYYMYFSKSPIWKTSTQFKVMNTFWSLSRVSVRYAAHRKLAASCRCPFTVLGTNDTHFIYG